MVTALRRYLFDVSAQKIDTWTFYKAKNKLEKEGLVFTQVNAYNIKIHRFNFFNFTTVSVATLTAFRILNPLIGLLFIVNFLYQSVLYSKASNRPHLFPAGYHLCENWKSGIILGPLILWKFPLQLDCPLPKKAGNTPKNQVRHLTKVILEL